MQRAGRAETQGGNVRVGCCLGKGAEVGTDSLTLLLSLGQK